MATRADLTERLRALLADEPSTREVSMFGGRAFMVNDRLVVSAGRTGELLVRVPRERHEELEFWLEVALEYNRGARPHGAEG